MAAIVSKLRVACSALALSLSLSSLAQTPGLAAGLNITDTEVIYALEKARILAPSIRVNARVGADEVMVATYKNPKAEDKDCKIEAVLIAKTVMDLAPNQIPRVTVYFYSSSALTKYKEVAVTAGDVKAFASGSLSKEELMASIKIKEDAISDPKQRIEEYLQEGQSSRKHKITTTLKGDEVLVTSGMDTSISERNLKFDALKLAEESFEAAPPEARRVVITFEDLAEGKKAILAFTREEVKSIDETISTRFKEVKMDIAKMEGKFADGKVDVTKLEAVDGPLKEEREKLVVRLKALHEAGVGFGTAPLEQFGEIESQLHKLSETELQEKINKLSELIAKFEENLKGAKEHKATAPSGKTPAAGEHSAAPTTPTTGGSAAVTDVDLKNRILANPDLYVSNMGRDLIPVSMITHQPVGKYKTPEDHPNFRRILQSVIDTLKAAGRNAEAQKFQSQLDAIKAKHGG